MGLLLSLAAITGCGRERDQEPHKAIPVREDGAIELNLMSWNVRYENSGDTDTRSWRQRVIGALRVIRRLNPDIIGVQEAMHGQAADLRVSLPDYEFIGWGRDDGKKAGEYAGIYYRRDRFKVDTADEGMFWLSDTPEKIGSKTWGNEIPRVATWLRLIDQATGRGFYVFNTHWDHRSQPSRERSALLIAKRIDSRKKKGEPVVLIGDFNSMEANPGLVYLTGMKTQVAGSSRSWAGGLLDVYQKLHSNEKNRRTLHLWRNTREGALKVDHILVSRDAEVRAADIVSGDTPMISDHFPVTARVLFPLKK